jgi:hypothetical protein
MRCKIDHQGAVFAVTMRVKAGPETQQESMRFLIVQESKNEMHGAPVTSRAEWDGDTLVIRSAAVIVGKELRLTDRWTLAADGARLTFRERHQFGTEPEGEDIQIFDRRPPDSWEPDTPPKAAEEVYKNIRIMKGVPAPRLPPTTASLR